MNGCRENWPLYSECKNGLLHIKCTTVYSAGVFYQEYLLNTLIEQFPTAVDKYSNPNTDGFWLVLSTLWQIIALFHHMKFSQADRPVK